MAFGMDTTLTAREASFVADVGYDVVTRAFEDRRVTTVAGRPRQRTLDLRGTLQLAVAERLKRYPAPVKKRIEGKVAETIREARALADVRDVAHTERMVVTTFRTSELARLAAERLATIDRMRALIAVDEDVQGGAPTFKGTRVLVRHIAGLVRNKIDRREIMEDFPEVTDGMIELAILFDRLYPQRGRPAAKGRGV
ncbi:DUF433 domain-containing protein [Azospirillum sp. RWY-5-1]|uniref:DUF433 domain-containing protein n=1 Tax=Azospirillum oleiclasticum TaxID=2735135 RepID=A0ABX2TC92_9PROT|nr:DUF433 domain-containing protein [Azospirillum oleiclasticum]NYZ16931.1 DUF433 domain-containing protein [Azospirillum oleiclasticum]NYZ21868.1 DUF433 domain-containing protein [Azospirillum oleiclasticum]